MSKAVIYIDTEDDITSIIDRVKASKSDIIALVPPKRIGVLQSIVNLKLLQRGAANAKKRVVLITSDQSLVSLAGGVKLPTAKNLQSRPEVAPVAALEVDGNDVINGNELAVGDMNDALSDNKLPADMPEPELPDDEPPIDKTAPLKRANKSGLAVPDFMKFRKRLLIGGGVAILLAIFLYWALWIAPSATVAITAQTEPVNVDRPLTLDPGAQEGDLGNNTLKPVTEQVKQTETLEFTATGEKTVGEKASGTAIIYNCEDDDSIGIPVGTALSANGLNFLTASTVTVPGAGVEGGNIACGTASVKINAQNIGEQYNVPGGTQFAVAGYDSDVYGRTENGTSGGSERQVTVVSEADVATAKENIANEDSDSVKQELIKKFSDDYYVVEASFQANTGAASVSPGVGQEASKATLTVETTYSIMAINKKDLSKVVANAIRDEISGEKQKKIYDNGLEELQISEYQSLEGGRATMRLNTTGYVGAEIDKAQLKEDMTGKQSGEIRELVEGLPNVQNVDVTFSPFWVTSVPDPEDIELKFEVQKNEE